MSFLTPPEGFLVVDVETTTKNKGNPFTVGNKMCAVGIWFRDRYYEWDIEHGTEPYAAKLVEINDLIAQANCVVGFNLKFDLHWLRNYLPDLRVSRLWDLQLFEFIRSNQNAGFPDLDSVAREEYGLPGKLDVVKTEYWDKDLDTTDVPWPVLSEYLRQDVMLTKQIFELQYPQFEDNRRTLFHLHCFDEIVLEEIEFNGLVYDKQQSLTKSEEVGHEILSTVGALTALVGNDITVNWNSTDHVSAVLYGGQIKYEALETVTRQYKHTSRTYERKCIRWHDLPRRVDPPDGSETKPTCDWSDAELDRINRERLADGKTPIFRVYSVDEDTLKGLRRHKSVRDIIDLLLQLANLRKLEGTYYQGIPDLMDTMGWPENRIHGQINQCRAITGRTASSKPNLQNFDGRLKYLFPSRFVQGL